MSDRIAWWDAHTGRVVKDRTEDLVEAERNVSEARRLLRDARASLRRARSALAEASVRRRAFDADPDAYLARVTTEFHAERVAASGNVG